MSCCKYYLGYAVTDDSGPYKQCHFYALPELVSSLEIRRASSLAREFNGLFA